LSQPLPYPARYESTIDIGDETIRVRPVRPDDTEIVAAFVQGLSDETMRLRFLGPRVTPTEKMLARATHVDYKAHMALIALAGEPSAPRQVAGARYITLADGISCEYAIVIADSWQGRGLGRTLMTMLVQMARDAGLKTMMGWVATNNGGMRRLCRRLGFKDHAVEGDATTRRVELQL
jgi:acetyltransferase